eukprot:1093790-Amphidinium_carterae.1
MMTSLPTLANKEKRGVTSQGSHQGHHSNGLHGACVCHSYEDKLQSWFPFELILQASCELQALQIGVEMAVYVHTHYFTISPTWRVCGPWMSIEAATRYKLHCNNHQCANPYREHVNAGPLAVYKP